jgi:hypothetical protein
MPSRRLIQTIVIGVRLAGALLLFVGSYLLIGGLLRVVRGLTHLTQSFAALLFALILIVAGMVFLKAPIVRSGRWNDPVR